MSIAATFQGVAQAAEIVQTIYFSRAVLQQHDFRPALQGILQTARARNRRLGVTGALLYGLGRFAQVLEGPPDAVSVVMAAIRRDWRHEGITVVRHLAPIHARCFTNWAMAGLVSVDGWAAVAPSLAGPHATPTDRQAAMLLAVLEWLTDGREPAPQAVPPRTWERLTCPSFSTPLRV